MKTMSRLLTLLSLTVLVLVASQASAAPRGPGSKIFPLPVPSNLPESKPSLERVLNANDFLSSVYNMSLELQLNGQSLTTLKENTVLQFQLKEINGGASTIPLTLSIEQADNGAEDVFTIKFNSFDPQVYALTLSIPQLAGTKVYNIQPNDQISLSAVFMHAVIFTGNEKLNKHFPLEDYNLIHQFTANNGVVPFEVRMHPAFYTPPSLP